MEADDNDNDDVHVSMYVRALAMVYKLLTLLIPRSDSSHGAAMPDRPRSCYLLIPPLLQKNQDQSVITNSGSNCGHFMACSPSLRSPPP